MGKQKILNMRSIIWFFFTLLFVASSATCLIYISNVNKTHEEQIGTLLMINRNLENNVNLLKSSLLQTAQQRDSISVLLVDTRTKLDSISSLSAKCTTIEIMHTGNGDGGLAGKCCSHSNKNAQKSIIKSGL